MSTREPFEELRAWIQQAKFRVKPAEAHFESAPIVVVTVEGLEAAIDRLMHTLKPSTKPDGQGG